MPEGKGTLTVQQLADRWQKSKWWIYENRESLGLKAIGLKSHYRFRLEDIERWEQEHMV